MHSAITALLVPLFIVPRPECLKDNKIYAVAEQNNETAQMEYQVCK